MFERESGGQVGRSKEIGDDLLGLVGSHALIFIAFAELGLEVGREAGAPTAIGIPRNGTGKVNLIVTLAAGLEERQFGTVVEVLPSIAVGQVGDVVPHIPGMGVLVITEESGGSVDL